jgi:uncharacterized membrane protein
MAAGYGFGSLLLLEPAERRKWFYRLGALLTGLFVLLRWMNVYGDPDAWSPQRNAVFTLFSFLNCHKYPPSLLYLLMTLGPAMLVLGFVDGGSPRWLKPVLVFGRVPLFYYLLHLPLIHGLAVLFAHFQLGRTAWLFENPFGHGAPAGYGYSLPVIYLIWMTVVVLLYPACRWFAQVKRRNPSAWLSYL